MFRRGAERGDWESEATLNMYESDMYESSGGSARSCASALRSRRSRPGQLHNPLLDRLAIIGGAEEGLQSKGSAAGQGEALEQRNGAVPARPRVCPPIHRHRGRNHL